MGLYNLRITGNVFRLPYQVHQETYDVIPVFIWQALRPEHIYHHPVIRDFHKNYGLDFYSQKRLISGFIVNIFFLVWMGFFSVNVLTIPLIRMFSVMVPWTLKNRWALFALLTYGVLISGLLIETYLNMHYLAPIIGFNYVFVLQAMRLWRWRNRRVGRLVLWFVPFLCVLLLLPFLYGRLKQNDSTAWQIQRARMNKQLKKVEGQHLIIVSYGRQHSFLEEWVYNEADIDGAKVVWARDMDIPENCNLLAYYGNRRIWSLEIGSDTSIPKLKPYPTKLCR
jgi:hypothetical protein